jgi:TonB-dependent receptor
MNLRYAVRLAISASLMAGSTVLFAQDRIDEIVVTGASIRDSQAAAIEAKRNAFNVKDIISADTVGRFPDQNLADSLGRLPGVAIERDQGQARFINFRGAPTRWTSISFDGIDVLGADNGRTPRFDSFPSVITRSIEASKAITPDMPAEAVAGFVDIKTFSPFEKEGFAASLEGGLGNQELGGGDVDKANARLSYSDEKFGVVVYASENSREQITDNREYELNIGSGAVPQPVSIDFRSYKVERKDQAYGGSMEYRPNSNTRVFVSTLYSEFSDREERNQYVFDIEGSETGMGVAGLPITGGQGYQPVVLVSRLLQDGLYKNSTETSTLGTDFLAAGWNIQARANYTETTNDMFLPIVRSVAGMAAASYDLTNFNDPSLIVYQRGTQTPADVNSIAYRATIGILYKIGMDTENWKFKLDADKEMEVFGLDSTVKFGLMSDTRAVEGGGGLGVTGFPANVNIQSFFTGEAWPTDFTNTIRGGLWDNKGLRNAWETAEGGLDTEFPADSIVEIDEEILVAYGMMTHLFDWGNLVWGARVEQTDFTSNGPDLLAAYNTTYTDVLPSAHLNIDLSEELKLRLSASSGISRPTYNEARASAIVDPTDRTISGGNPALEAETALGIDASLEYYFAPASIFSAAAFHRAVDNVLYVDTTRVDGGLYVPGDAGVLYDLSGTVNGREGSLSGLEFNLIAQASDFLPEVFDGFGISLNATFLDSEFETLSGKKFNLPGTSDAIYNASLFYERGGLSARVNTMWRDAWLSSTESDTLAEYWDEQTRVDLSLRYTLPETLTSFVGVTLFANVNNLSDEVDVRYIGSPATPNQVERYGRYSAVGLRVDF